MNVKDFENKSFMHNETNQNDVESLKSQLDNIISKREKISRYLENILGKERDLKQRIYLKENGY